MEEVDKRLSTETAELKTDVENLGKKLQYLETTHKNSAKTAGPAGRFINAWALRIFTRLAKPERMAWMFDYRIDWDSPAGGARLEQSASRTH